MINLTTKVRQITKVHGQSNDVAARLKATRLGQFYKRSIKQYDIARLLFIWLWRNTYPIYVNHIAIHLRNKREKKWRALTTLSDFVRTRNLPTTKLGDEAQVETPPPIVYPTCDQHFLSSPHEHYRFPEVFVAEIDDGVIYGGTNLILTKDKVISHDLYDFTRDYTSEELHGRTLIDPRAKRIRWLLHDETPEHLPVAASFVDACAPNYAHWLTEVLPRIALFCAEEQFKDIPVVLNSGLHRNIMESLFMVGGQGREIITLPVGRALNVETLYLTSATGYVPFERRNKKLTRHSHGLFSPLALECVRDRINFYSKKLPKLSWPEKIYLRRNSGIRKVTNEVEVEEFLVTRGYVIIEPEKLTFLQQVQLFSNAKVIIGSSGAALANIVFSSSEARIIIMISKYPETSYWYWQNIAAASGKAVHYLFGEVKLGDANGIHADFKIDIHQLRGVLTQSE